MPSATPPDGFSWVRLANHAVMESGHTPSRSHPEYWDGDIPWLGIRDATGNHGLVIHSTRERVTQAGIDNSSTRIIPAGSVCLSRTASVGYVVQAGVPLATSQDFVNWICRPTIHADFLRYLFVAEQESIRMFSSGSVHPTMYYPEAKALHVCVPSIGEQRAIADVLGALDDKIAANRRIAELAQQLAATEFAAAVSVVKDSGKTFDEVAVVGGGGTPKTSIREFWDGGVAWLTPTDVTALEGSTVFATSRTLTESGLRSCASPLYPEGTIFMTSRATIGAMAIAGRPMAVNQGFIAVQPPSGLRWWLFHEMRSRVDEFLSWANGATFMELSRGTFRRLPVRLADPETISMFESRAEALHAKEATVIAEVNSLAATRDALLPALMSGRLTVRDAERVVADAT